MNARAFIGTVCFGAMLIGAVGCATDPATGYTTAGQYRTGIRTVAVPIWSRSQGVYRRGTEDRLTEALVKRIELDTPYKTTKKATADTELSGTVENISQRVLSYNPDTGRARELELTLTVSFTWTDLRDGSVILRRKKFSVAGTYIVESGFSEDFFQGSEDVINELAKRIVEQMEAPW